jgi:8-oxo-dGTP pyrophosphatase MutT (NUDIX family)
MWDYTYEREIRSPSGDVYLETYGVDTNAGEMYQRQRYILILNGQEVGRRGWRHETTTDETVDEANTMPEWWHWPSNTKALCEKYEKNGKQLLPTTRNVVTFVTYMANGRMQLQQRSYVSPQGKPIANPGFLSINGGLMESDDIEAELHREALEELGIDIGVHFAKVGDIYDAEAGRTNHVFCLTVGYDDILQHTAEPADAIAALTSPEGLGRAFVWREDLEAIMAAKTLTGISVRILEAYPKLLPLPRPKA